MPSACWLKSLVPAQGRRAPALPPAAGLGNPALRRLSPHQDLVSERLATLYEVQSGQCDLLLVPATTALLRMAPPQFLAAYTFFFKQGEKLDEAKLKSQLTLAGYTHVAR
jgi:transcription-repair coupling factor (superfamily II helicase)